MDTQPVSSSSSSSSTSTSTTTITTSSGFKFFGVTSCGNSDHGCNNGQKDCTSESLLSSITFLTSTSFERKSFDSPQVLSSSPSLSLSLSLGERVSKTATLVMSRDKKRKSARSLLLERKERQEFSRLGISWDLSLLYEPWKITKRLYKSDLGNHCRLLISKKDAIAHVMPFMDKESKEAIKSNGGMGVIVSDMDTGTEHNLVFRFLSSMECYILRKGWNIEFVERRKLQEGDEVGLCWDVSSRKFNFSVLHRATNRSPKGKVGSLEETQK